jgi:hypothetical protein
MCVGGVLGLAFFLLGVAFAAEVRNPERFFRTWLVAQVEKEFLWFVPACFLWWCYYAR